MSRRPPATGDSLQPARRDARRNSPNRSQLAAAILDRRASRCTGSGGPRRGGDQASTICRVVDASPPETSADNPAPLALGTIQKIGLGPNQEYYLQLPEPVGDLKIVADMRQHRQPVQQSSEPDLDCSTRMARCCRIASSTFNEIDVGARQTATWSTRQPARVGVRAAERRRAGGFLAERPAGIGDSVRPAVWQRGAAGRCRSAKTSPGCSTRTRMRTTWSRSARASTRSRSTLPTPSGGTRTSRDRSRILDADGGNYREIVRFNEIDVSARKVETFLVRDDGPAILNVAEHQRHGQIHAEAR